MLIYGHHTNLFFCSPPMKAEELREIVNGDSGGIWLASSCAPLSDEQCRQIDELMPEPVAINWWEVHNYEVYGEG